MSHQATSATIVGERLVHLAEILEASTDYVATTDVSGDLLYANAAFRNRFGVRAVDGLVSQRYNLFDFFTDDSRERLLHDAVPGLWAGESWSGELAAKNPDGGDPIALWQSAITHVGVDGRPKFFSGIARDMSAIKAAAADMQKSEERFRALVAQGSDIILIVSPAGRITYATPSIERILGHPVDTLIDTTAFDLIHPDDLDEVVGRFIAVATGDDGRRGTQCRIHHADGTWRWVELFGSDHTATAGVGGLIVNARDITARHDANEDLARSAALLSSVMRASASEAIFVTDSEARIVAFSRGAECLLGYTANEVVGLIHPRAFHPHDELSTLAAELGIEPDGLFVHEPPHGQSLLRQLTFVRKDRTTFDGSLVVSARHEPDGSLAGFLYIATDITERLQREATLTRAADHDSLTGLANRNFLHRALGIAVHEDSWHSPGRVVLFLDLDRFKNVNDTLGHAAGDAVLVAVAHRLTELLRTDDLAVRLGGDEFVVLLAAGITTPQAIKVAERIVAAIGREFTIGGQRIAIGASVGLSRSRQSWTPEKLLQSADTAAYQAKNSGRGKVISTVP